MDANSAYWVKRGSSRPRVFSAQAGNRAPGTRSHRFNLRNGLPHSPCADEEAKIMRMRMGAPLWVALVSLWGAAQTASAGICGAGLFSSLKQPCCDAQCCFSSCQEQGRVSYKLVYDTVNETRFHTCYKTVN